MLVLAYIHNIVTNSLSLGEFVFIRKKILFYCIQLVSPFTCFRNQFVSNDWSKYGLHNIKNKLTARYTFNQIKRKPIYFSLIWNTSKLSKSGNNIIIYLQAFEMYSFKIMRRSPLQIHTKKVYCSLFREYIRICKWLLNIPFKITKLNDRKPFKMIKLTR